MEKTPRYLKDKECGKAGHCKDQLPSMPAPRNTATSALATLMVRVYIDAKAVQAVNENLQPLKIVGEENNVIAIAQDRHTAARAQHQARPRCRGIHVLMQAINKMQISIWANTQ